MIKGTQRQMVMVRTLDSKRFEMAYFVLRSDAGGEGSEKSMIDEANNIVSSVCDGRGGERREKRVRAFRRGLVFLAGAVFGALVLGAILAVVFVF